MRFRYGNNPYRYGLTWYRNMAAAIRARSTGGSAPLKVLKEHARNAGVWNVQAESETGQRVGPAVDVAGAVDLVNQVHSMGNTDKPECMTSFICTLAKDSGVMSAEELEVMLDHQAGYLLQSTRGRKIVKEYHKLGAVLERKMQQDMHKLKMYQKLYDTWLKKVVELIKAKEYDEAEKVYYECVRWLCEYYEVKNGYFK